MAIENSPESVIMYFDTLNDISSSIFGLPSTQTILNSTLGQMERVSRYNLTDYPLALFANACDSFGLYQNCIEACGYPFHLFYKPETWWTCLSLTVLALERSFFNMSQSITAEIDVVLSRIGVNNIADFDGIDVLNKTLQCAMASISEYNVEESSPKVEPGGTNYSEVYDAISRVCYFTSTDINIDIAGSGVLISYVTQSIIAIASWALMKIFTARAAMDSFMGAFLPFKRKNGLFSQMHTRLTPSLLRIEQLSLSHATSALLVEFQEAQCFFIFAIAIALLYADSRVLNLYDATSWQSVADTGFWVKWLASQGIWSIILTQISLRYIGLDSIYSLVLSTTAVALIAAAALKAVDLTPERMYEILYSVERSDFEECGPAPSLQTFCLYETTSYYPGIISIFSNILLLLIYILLWWEKLSGTAMNNLIVQAGFNVRINSLRAFLAKFKYITLWLKAVLVTVAEFWAVSYLVRSLFYLIENLSIESDLQLDIGQVISILVWAPVIAKFLYLIAVGIEKGFRMRLPGVFTVLRVQDPAQTEYSERDQSFSSESE